MFSFFKKIKSAFAQKIKALFSKSPDESTFDHLEQIFFEADLGAAMAAELVDKIRILYKKDPQITSDAVLGFVKQQLLQVCIPSTRIAPVSPHVILLVGVNGSGKTTTVAKLAAHYKKEGKKVLIAAGDTFRAAAVEQLETWAKKIGVEFVKSQPFSDPSAVAFDALSAALARKIDIVLIDTAGRLQTKTDLMQELAKIRRVCQKQIPDAPQETLLVLDSTIGQNAIDQATIFHKFTPITGIVLSKLDGSAKGGIAIAIQKELRVPIQWVGTGEGIDDFAPFAAEEYVTALFS